MEPLAPIRAARIERVATISGLRASRYHGPRQDARVVGFLGFLPEV